ncbi:hypothetical protein [Natranaerofaba carboxydovora]|uniref:hypothetical protein n=1 Tax=Natranaerofaba carboxydovora TaxID=2742683 RepID=UPI001F12D519|nr:hypothetical protein [Natranaerofaba carboxydovora]UMZ74068.1 hypothetical protein ACONDI_01641 [Natranaerofaba carboxydovora]
MEFLFAVLILGCIFVDITYMLSRLFKKRILKYIPSFLLMGAAVYLVISARYFATDGITSLIKGIWSVMLFCTSMISIMAAIVINKCQKKKEEL